MVVGAPLDEGTKTRSGAAYVFVRATATGAWMQQAKLKATGDVTPDATFGQAVAIAGDTVIVGASGGDKDSVYVFGRSGESWSLKQTFASNGDFGGSLAISGNRFVVGRPQSSNGGEAVIYERPTSASQWTEVTTHLTASDRQLNEAFGTSVAMIGNRIVVGAPNWDNAKDTNNDGSPEPIADQGRAFVFDLVGTTWVRVARLTADGGLPRSAAALEGKATDHFGATVALDSDSDGATVVVGAPGYDGDALDQGAAYAFYALADQGSGTGSSWLRASGSSGSGRLTAEQPTGATPAGGSVPSEYLTADRFGSSVVVGGGRIVIGLPGFNGTLFDLGAVRTFIPGDAVSVSPYAPNSTLPAYAEILSGTTGFGSHTAYEPNSRTLFVASPGAGTVGVYVNEGLSWRFVENLTQSDNTSQFGAALAVDGDTLVVGAPGAGKAYVYARYGELWNTSSTTLDGVAGSQFGAAVAVKGSKIVVGAPKQTVTYKSTNQPADVLSPGTNNPYPGVTLANSGAAFVYSRTNGTWDTSPQLLMPDDANLPESWRVERNVLPEHTGEVFIGGAWRGLGMTYFADTGNNPTVTIGPYSAVIFGDRDDGGWDTDDRSWQFYKNDSATAMTFELPGKIDPDCVCVGYTNGNSASRTAGAYFGTTHYTEVGIIWTGYPGGLRFAADRDSFLAFFGYDPFGGWKVNGLLALDGELGGTYGNVWLAKATPPYTYKNLPNVSSVLDNAAWGTSVAIDGSDSTGYKVAVGAPDFGGAAGRTGFYDLSGIPTSNWTATAGPFSGNPLRTTTMVSSSAPRDGSAVVMNAGTVFVGHPTSGSSTSVAVLSSAGGDSGAIAAPGSASSFGDRNTLAARGNRLIVGDPANDHAYVYAIDTKTYTGIDLRPFKIDQATNAEVVDSLPAFGVAGAVISEGVYVVGTQTSNDLYTYRPRARGWVAGATTTATSVSTAKAGTGIAIDGDTSVVGAPDYDGRGAVFVSTSSAGSDVWSQQAVLQSLGGRNGDRFGESVGISGDTIIVGAPAGGEDRKGRATIFQRIGSTWTQVKELAAPVGTANTFGNAVAIDGNTAIVGDARSNRSYVYKFVNFDWILADTIGDELALGYAAGFGTSVAISDDEIIVGAPAYLTTGVGKGAAFVYARNGATWTASDTLLATDGVANDLFGSAVDISAGHAIVGAPGVVAGSGAAYMFELTGGRWSQKQARLVMQTASPSQAPSGALVDKADHFGGAVAIDGERAIVGAWGRNRYDAADRSLVLVDAGEALPFSLRKGTWKLDTVENAVAGADAAAGDYVGYSVALDGSQAALGAPQIDGRRGQDAKATAGAGYAFIRTVSAPTTVTLTEVQETLKDGAQANVITGTVGGKATSSLHFFDISAVTLRTGAADDSITIGADGLTAYGLTTLDILTDGGADTLTVLSSSLVPSGAGKYQPTGNFGTAQPGDLIPVGASYGNLAGLVRFDGGGGSNTVVADANADWSLTAGALMTGEARLDLAHVNDVSLLGGEAANRFVVSGWMGSLTVDGRGGSDEVVIDAGVASGGTPTITINDTGSTPGDVDELTVLGGDGNDAIRFRTTSAVVNNIVVFYSDYDVLRIGTRGGDDTIDIVDASVSALVADGGEGSDAYSIFDSATVANIRISDSGVLPPANTDTVTIGLNVPTTQVTYDDTIESVTRKLLKTLAELTSLVIPAGAVVSIDGAFLRIGRELIDVTDVIELTLDGRTGGGQVVEIHQLLSTLKTLALNGGSAGGNTIVRSLGKAEWRITGVDAGQIIGGTTPITFSNFGTLVGGDDDDTFTFVDDTAVLTGGIDGRGGVNTLDYSGRTASVTVDLSTEAATGASGPVSGIDVVVGSAGVDTLIGANSRNVWHLTGQDAGDIGGTFFYSSVENPIGGGESDQFLLSSAGRVSGTIDGGSRGEDELAIEFTQNADDVEASGLTVTRIGGTIRYRNIDTLSLATGDGMDVVTISVGGPGAPSAVNVVTGNDDDLVTLNVQERSQMVVSIDGGSPSASDVVRINGTAGDDSIDVTGRLVTVNQTTIGLAGIEILTVAGGEGADTTTATGVAVTESLALLGEGGDDSITLNAPILPLQFVAGTAAISVDGGSGSGDSLTVNFGVDAADVTLTATGVDVGSNKRLGYAAFESLVLVTGSAADIVAIRRRC